MTTSRIGCEQQSRTLPSAGWSSGSGQNNRPRDQPAFAVVRGDARTIRLAAGIGYEQRIGHNDVPVNVQIEVRARITPPVYTFTEMLNNAIDRSLP